VAERPSRFQDVKPVDALGKLSERARASRYGGLAIAVVGFIVLAILAGFLFKMVVSGVNAPEVPRVEL